MLPRCMTMIVPYTQHISQYQDRQHHAAGFLATENECKKRNRQHACPVNSCFRHACEQTHGEKHQKFEIGEMKGEKVNQVWLRGPSTPSTSRWRQVHCLFHSDEHDPSLEFRTPCSLCFPSGYNPETLCADRSTEGCWLSPGS